MKSAEQEVNGIANAIERDATKKKLLSERLKLVEIELLAIIQECEELGYIVHIERQIELFRDLASVSDIELTTGVTITASKTKTETL